MLVVGIHGLHSHKLLNSFLRQLVMPVHPVQHGKLQAAHFPVHSLYVLGIYDGKEPSGVDRLPWDVQGDACRFLHTIPADSRVLFGGKRLFNGAFMDYCHSLPADCHWVTLGDTWPAAGMMDLVQNRTRLSELLFGSL